MQFTKYGTVAVGVASILGLSGCTSTTDPGVEALDRAATSVDYLPDNVLAQGVLTETVRYLAEHEGITYFVAESDTEGLCVIQTQNHGEAVWAVVCGPGPIVSSQAAGIPTTVALVTDSFTGDDFDDDWTKIHANLYLR
jgi:hypothetical protein